MVDVMPSGKMEEPLFVALKMADVIALWQDGTATIYGNRRWQMLLPGGRWNSHCVVMADVNAKWQMELPLRVSDGAWWML